MKKLFSHNSRHAAVNATLGSKRYVWQWHGEVEGLSLSSFLIEKLSLEQELPADETLLTRIQERLRSGGIHVNGRVWTENKPLPCPARIEYFEPKYSDPLVHFPQFQSNFIVYEDEFLSFVYKPAKLPTLPSRDQTKYNMKTYLEEHYKTQIHIPSRLDTATAGILPVSRNKLMHSVLQRMFERKVVVKRYLFGVSVRPTFEKLCVDAHLTMDETHHVLRKVSEGEGVRALTFFRYIGSASKDHHLIEARPLTGRTHQIRVHAMHLGLPLIGDSFYGGSNSAELELCCYQLTLYHPFLREVRKIDIPSYLRPQWLLDFGDILPHFV